MTVPYSFRLPEHYKPWRKYPLVVVLPGWGSGFDGQNEGVQVAVDITAVIGEAVPGRDASACRRRALS